MRKYMSMLYILSNLLDLSFTVYGVNLTGIGMETNPIAQDVILSHGFTGLSIFKLAGMAFTLVLCAILVRVRWEDLWVNRYVPPLILLVGSIVSLVGAWSWICVFQEV